MLEFIPTASDDRPPRTKSFGLERLNGSVRSVEFNFTNECNLRCVYCPQGSHDETFHAETPRELLKQIIDYIRDNAVEHASVGYYGETTLVSGWEDVCREILDMGVKMTIVSNFSRVLAPEEVAVLARFQEIQVSLDIVDVAILKSVRKAVDARTILYNSQLIQAHAIQHDLPLPRIRWTGVLTDKVVMGLTHYVAVAISCGVKEINFNSVAYFDGAKDIAVHVCEMPDGDFCRAVEEIERASALASKHGVCLEVQDLGRIRRRLFKLTGRTRALDDGRHLARLTDLSADDRIYVYGSGVAGRWVAKAIQARRGLHFGGFIDSSRSGEVDGSPLHRLDEYLSKREEHDLILICSGAYDEIAQGLAERGVDRHLDAREIYLQNVESRPRAIDNNEPMRRGIQGAFSYVDDGVDDIPSGFTRRCDSPWTQIYLDPKGEAYSCCQRGQVMGRLGPGQGIADILNNAAYQKLRRELLSGEDLNPECRRCVAMRAVPPEAMQNWIEGELA